jgi:2-iminobutanoate/2-iminopropanoate deaminase
VFLTGQMPTDPNDADAALPEGIEMQTRRVMDNLILVLEGMSLGLGDVASVRIFLPEFKRDFYLMNDVYKSYFPKEKLPSGGRTGRDRCNRTSIANFNSRPDPEFNIPDS